MTITSDQSRAARGLLGWTQEQLAANANVSRAMIADFESNTRAPMKNNLSSIEDSISAAGLEFIREEGNSGVGVRFRERKLEYTKNLQVDWFDGRAVMRMRYAGKQFLCEIGRATLEDFCHTTFSGAAEFLKGIEDNLHRILASVERAARNGIQEGRFVLTVEMLDSSLV